MPVFPRYLAILLFGLFRAEPALGADAIEHACLDKAEQRVAITTHKTVPLAQVIKTRREKGHHAEVVRARLCRHGDGLVYVLTLLGRSGRVFRETVDAANGDVISER